MQRKNLGQNFLKKEYTAKDLVKAAHLTREDVVIEVGAGTGTVTKELSKTVDRVIAIEFDKNLIPALKDSLKDLTNVKIICEDALAFFKSSPEFGYKVVGSIPYQITSPLLHKLFTLDKPPQSIALIIQYEVAKKITAKVPRATYLSNLTSLFGNAKFIKRVKKENFHPKPKVESAIIHIEKRRKSVENFAEWVSFLHRGFSHPRKMLKTIFGEDILKKAGVDYCKRAQELTLEEWVRIFKNFNNETT